MFMKGQLRNLSIYEGKIHLVVPHCDWKICGILPIHEGSYSEIYKSTSEQGLQIPTMGEASSIVLSLMKNPEEDSSKMILNYMNQGRPFYVSTFLLEKEDGFYAIDHPPITPEGEIDILEKKLGIDHRSTEREDGHVKYNLEHSVRYTPKGNPSGEQDSEGLSKRRKVRAMAGNAGARNLEEIAKKKGDIVFVGGDNNSLKRNIKIPALYFSTTDGKLVIAGDDYNTDRSDGFTIPIGRSDGMPIRKELRYDNLNL